MLLEQRIFAAYYSFLRGIFMREIETNLSSTAISATLTARVHWKWRAHIAAMSVCLFITPLFATTADAYILQDAADVARQSKVQLEVTNGDKIQYWSRAELLAKAQSITIQTDSAYKRTMQYRAVPIASVLPSAERYASVQFVASDGFVANIAGKDLAGAGQAYLAIEEQTHPWPAIDANNPHKTASAGPFYLVWLDPQAGKISNEQWPYQVVKIRVEQPLLSRFPQLVPPQKGGQGSSPTNAQALRGLQVFVKNCAVCHKMSGAGDGEIGPDLNQPYNPTQYFKTEFLRKLIRQPASVRSWKTSMMPGFDAQTISDAELDDLLVYLQQMASKTRSR